MLIGRWRKQPRDRLRYKIDFVRWISSDDELLTEIEVTITQPVGGIVPLVAEGAWIAPDGKSVTLLISGGTDLKDYPVRLNATTVDEQVKEVDLLFQVREL